MTTRRLAKVERAIREAISTAVLFELRDPRVSGVTILRITVAPDLLVAKVYVSIMGDEKKQSLCLHGLRSARGFLQKKVADRIQTKNTPILSFELDDSIRMSAEASRILRQMTAEGKITDYSEGDDEEVDSEDSSDLTDEHENHRVEDDNST
ncbi:ribosome-binding factor A [Lacunimicrobium album]